MQKKKSTSSRAPAATVIQLAPAGVYCLGKCESLLQKGFRALFKGCIESLSFVKNRSTLKAKSSVAGSSGRRRASGFRRLGFYVAFQIMGCREEGDIQDDWSL